MVPKPWQPDALTLTFALLQLFSFGSQLVEPRWCGNIMSEDLKARTKAAILGGNGDIVAFDLDGVIQVAVDL